MPKKLKALGIMNGTSLDAVDYCLIETDSKGNNPKFLKHAQKSFPKPLKEKLLRCARDETTTSEVSEINFELGKLYAKQIKQLSGWRFDIIGVHGQTVFHEGKQHGLQLGHPAPLALTAKKPVYFDFRSADIVAGGQGAPFAPFFQRAITKTSNTAIAFHNLGGISNLTLIKGKSVVAFDTGPANILMNAWVDHKKGKGFDRDGKFAKSGLPDPLVVNDFLNHPYFKKKAPKSTGRELFNLEFIKDQGGRLFRRLNFEDQMATLTEVTAKSIADDYKKLKSQPEVIYFYGGGTQNPYLMERVRYWLSPLKIATTDDIKWPSQALEAATFAYLATARHLNKKVHLKEVTGAKTTVNLGSVYF